MKLKKHITAILLISFTMLFTNCKKEVDALLNPKSTITVINKTFTTVDITFNSETKTILPGASSVFTGSANAAVSGYASTSGKTSTGILLGSLMTWNISENFPAANGTLDYYLDITSNTFFVKIQNNSTQNIQKVYVNYGAVNQSVENILIPNDGVTYFIGYYRAYTNSNIRAENGTTFWFLNPLNLPFTVNQSKTLIAY